MLNGFIILLVYLFVGDLISNGFDLPVPGGIIGMILLFITMIIRGKIDEPIEGAAQSLIAYIGLLFVPAGVGVSQYFDLLAAQWPIIIVAGISTMFLTLAVSAFLFHLLSKKSAKP